MPTPSKTRIKSSRSTLVCLVAVALVAMSGSPALAGAARHAARCVRSSSVARAKSKARACKKPRRRTKAKRVVIHKATSPQALASHALVVAPTAPPSSLPSTLVEVVGSIGQGGGAQSEPGGGESTDSETHGEEGKSSGGGEGGSTGGGESHGEEGKSTGGGEGGSTGGGESSGGEGKNTSGEKESGASEQRSEPAPFRFFASTSFWNQELTAKAPLDPTSLGLVAGLVSEVIAEEALGTGPSIDTTSWSVPLYTVGATQPSVRVTLTNGSKAPALQAAWAEVPLPADARPAEGTDKHLVVWQPSSDRLWEFWDMEHKVSGWQAAWGGAIEHVSKDSGAYGSEAWSGATSTWGASASSLSIAGGLITIEDLEKGKINHALAMSVPDVRASEYASPAERTDGWSDSLLSLPEGAHLRLDPSLDLASLHLPRFTLMLAEAAQHYGIYIRDSANDYTFYGQDPTPLGKNPYTGAHGFFEGKTAQSLLDLFPWSHLQLLKMELH